MTRFQLLLCTTAFSAVVYLPGVSTRAAEEPASSGRSVAQPVRRAPRASGPARALRVASRPGAPG